MKMPFKFVSFIFVVGFIWLVSQAGRHGTLGFVTMTIIILLGFIIFYFSGHAFIRQLVQGPLQNAGIVLRNAAIEVHAVTAVDATANNLDDWQDYIAQTWPKEAGDSFKWQWYKLDITLCPHENHGGNIEQQPWHPHELLFVSNNAIAGYFEDTGGLIYGIESVKFWQAGKFMTLDQTNDTCTGPSRLEWLIWVEKSTTNIQFRYYLELFGDVSLSS